MMNDTKRYVIITTAMMLFVVLNSLIVVESAVVIPLTERERTEDEKYQLLNFLQLKEEDEDEDAERPNIRLDTTFFGNIEIGDTKQQFKVIFDTGSSVLWVYSEACAVCKGNHEHFFSSSGSHTFKKRQTPFSIRYGTGESKGTTGVDKMYIADLEVSEQPFGQCEQPDSVMNGFPFDGIVGLSRALVRDPNAMPTVIETIKKERLLEQKNLVNSFSFYIGREQNEQTYLIFGGSHESLEEDKNGVHWIGTLNKNMFWEIPLDDIFIHHKGKAATKISTHHSLENHHHHQNSISAKIIKHHNNKKSKTHKILTPTTSSTSHKRQFEEEEEEEEEEKKFGLLAHTQKSKNQENSELGVGQLRSDVHSPGESIAPCLQDNEHMCIISVDSGHSLMSGPPDVIKKLKQQLEVPGGQCTDEVIASMPDVSFMMGGKLFTLKPEDYLINYGGACAPAFSERKVRNGHDWILGEHFMRSFYTVFDHDNMRIGFSHLSTTRDHLAKILQQDSVEPLNGINHSKSH